MSIFDTFSKRHDFLVCVDSDGCAMDTMDIKHIRCFGPCMVAEWGLDQWREPILKQWNEINLYTMTRGINRFQGLSQALTEIDAKYTPIEGAAELAAWVAETDELSNYALQEAIHNGGGICLQKALHWSQAVNTAITQLPDAEKKPFPGVSAGLEAAHAVADVVVVSSANRDAVVEEWEKYGLSRHVDLLLAQDAGSKSYCIAQLLNKGYDPRHVLMVGDAPGDQAAAEQNDVWFYPILVRHEAESWAELAETALDKLLCGNYQSYGQEKAAAFHHNLGA